MKNPREDQIMDGTMELQNAEAPGRGSGRQEAESMPACQEERPDPEEIPDAELIRRYREGDAGAMDLLLERYKQMVRVKSRALYLAGGDRDDLLQEGMLGLFKAVQSYDPEKSSFATYASVCVNRQMYTAVQADRRKKNQPLNGSVSIHTLEEADEDAQLGSTESPESLLVKQEELERKIREIRERLSPYEKEVLQLYLDGNDYRKIAGITGKTPKSVDNALNRIRRKAGSV